MGVCSFFAKEIQREGLRSALFKTLKKSMKRVLGIDKLEEENRTLYYFLNVFFKAKDTPRAEGSLRQLQLCDVMLLNIFEKICKSNGLTYWLDFGTLLGAYRHQGFIPWDDDLDVSMLRTDYEKAIPILEKSFTSLGLGFEAAEKPGAPMVRIGIGYKHSDTGVWLDVFPVDLIETSHSKDEIYAPLCKKMITYRKYYYRNRNKISNETIKKKKKAIITLPSGKNKMLYHGPEYIDVSCYIHNYEDIFPLCIITFENFIFPAPKACERYLSELYGENYMTFPHDGVEHHGGEDNKLAQWSEKSHTDLNVIYAELERIFHTL